MTAPKKSADAAALLAAKLRVVTEAAPGLRAAGVKRLRIDGDRIDLDPPAIEPKKRRLGDEDEDDSEDDKSLLDTSNYRRPKAREKDD